MKVQSLFLGMCAMASGKYLRKLGTPEQDAPILKEKINGYWWADASMDETSVDPTQGINIFDIQFNPENNLASLKVCSGRITNDINQLNKKGLNWDTKYQSFQSTSSWIQSNEMSYDNNKYSFYYTLPSSTHAWQIMAVGGFHNISDAGFMNTYPINDYAHHTYFSMVKIDPISDAKFLEVVAKECSTAPQKTI